MGETACVQTYLEQNEGEGLQHLALKTDDIFATLRALRSRSGPNGGLEFMKPASKAYYQCAPPPAGRSPQTRASGTASAACAWHPARPLVVLEAHQWF